MVAMVQISLHPLNRDFRRELLRAAARRADRAVHIECGSDIVVSEIFEDESIRVSNGLQAVYAVCETLEKKSILVFTGFGSVNSSIGMRVSKLFPKKSRFYDVIDDLSYGATGFAYLKYILRDMKWRRHCQRAIVLEEGMKHRYGNSIHLDNASNLTSDNNGSRRQAMVYIGSFDDRLDIDMMETFGTVLPIDIYGRSHKKWPDAFERLEKFAATTSNVRLMGSYDNDDLGQILAGYKFGIVPYKVGDRLTNHINPDKIYHYLNAGLAVISSEIPQAIRMESYVGLYRKNRPVLDVLAEADSKVSLWISANYSWDQRWSDLMVLLDKEPSPF